MRCRTEWKGGRHLQSGVKASRVDVTYVLSEAATTGSQSLASIAANVENIQLIVNGGIEKTNYQHVATQFPGALLAVGKKALATPDFVQRLKDGKEMSEINFEMLLPKATITNELAWRKKYSLNPMSKANESGTGRLHHYMPDVDDLFVRRLRVWLKQN